MASSYDKVYESLTKTQMWKNLNEAFCIHLNECKLDFGEFRYVTYGTAEDDRQRVIPKFLLNFFGTKRFLEPDSLQGFQFSHYMSMLKDVELNFVPNQMFGTSECPTYNCSKIKLLEGNKKMTKWADFARVRLVQDNVALVSETSNRIKEQYLTIKSSEDFARDKERFYETIVIKEIREVVLKYYDKVGPEVLKEALDQVVMEHIIIT